MRSASRVRGSAQPGGLYPGGSAQPQGGLPNPGGSASREGLDRHRRKNITSPTTLFAGGNYSHEVGLDILKHISSNLYYLCDYYSANTSG